MDRWRLMFNREFDVFTHDFIVVIADGVERMSIGRYAIMWSAIVLLVLGPIGIVAWSRTKRRNRELDAAERLADNGLSADEIVKIVHSDEQTSTDGPPPADGT